MTDKTFTASNGFSIEEADSVELLVYDKHGSLYTNISEPLSDALREYYEHERDHKLGRARWPENPDYVIYRDESEDDKDGRYVRVVNESKGISIAFWEKLTFRSSQNYDRAARWYFTEGPGKPERPWEDAQAGEVWRLTIDGEEGNYLVKAGGEGPQYLSGQRDCFVVDHTRITAGRKVLNADGSVADE